MRCTMSARGNRRLRHRPCWTVTVDEMSERFGLATRPSIHFRTHQNHDDSGVIPPTPSPRAGHVTLRAIDRRA